MHPFSIKESIRFGWDTFKKRPWILIGSLVIGMVVSGVSSSVLTPPEGAPFGIIPALMAIVSIIIGTFVEIGLTTFALKAHDSVESVQVKDLWNPKPFWYYLAGQIVVGAVVIIGFILLIIPGIILSLGLMFAAYLIIDKGRGPIESMKESWRITKGHKGYIALFTLALGGLNVLGFLALIVGLLVTIPVTMLAMVHVYRKLEHAASEVEPMPTPHQNLA